MCLFVVCLFSLLCSSRTTCEETSKTSQDRQPRFSFDSPEMDPHISSPSRVVFPGCPKKLFGLPSLSPDGLHRVSPRTLSTQRQTPSDFSSLEPNPDLARGPVETYQPGGTCRDGKTSKSPSLSTAEYSQRASSGRQGHTHALLGTCNRVFI